MARATACRCKACGFVSDIDPRHKLNTFILKNPPENKMSKEEKKCVRASVRPLASAGSPGGRAQSAALLPPERRPAPRADLCAPPQRCLTCGTRALPSIPTPPTHRLKKAEEERLRDAEKAEKREKKEKEKEGKEKKDKKSKK